MPLDLQEQIGHLLIAKMNKRDSLTPDDDGPGILSLSSNMQALDRQIPLSRPGHNWHGPQ